jgi:hypothetical protein
MGPRFESRIPGDPGIVARRREALVLLRHFQPVLVPHSGRFLCMSDFRFSAREVARQHGVRSSVFLNWWRKETQRQFGRVVRWPRIALQSATFCCDFSRTTDVCPVCMHLKPELRLQTIYNPQNISIPAIVAPDLWPSLMCKPFLHLEPPLSDVGEVLVLLKDTERFLSRSAVQIVHECNQEESGVFPPCQ